MGDVGTDHAFLPVYAVLNGYANKAVASDINKGPIERAKKHISEYGLNDRIETRLCSGLEKYEKGECDLIVIAGMGGNLIAEILDKSPDVARSADKLVLSPNSCESDLRKYLYENGYDIISESAVSEGKHQYLVMTVKYTGNIRNVSETVCYIGEKLIDQTDDEDVRAYLNKLKRKITVRMNGLKKAEHFDSDQFELLQKILRSI